MYRPYGIGNELQNMSTNKWSHLTDRSRTNTQNNMYLIFEVGLKIASSDTFLQKF